MGFLFDSVTGVMLIVVTLVSSLVHIFSMGYMHGDPYYSRFFAFLSLFSFSMLFLVVSDNLLGIYIGWELVGVCSYLLIGFWYHKQSATDAGKKAFLVNRIGDWGFVLGIFLVFFTFGTIEFEEVMVSAAAMPIEAAGFGVISVSYTHLTLPTILLV